jgi:hypothetical protein
MRVDSHLEMKCPRAACDGRERETKERKSYA